MHEQKIKLLGSIMKRRKFLQLTSASGPALALTGLISCSTSETEKKSTAGHKVKPFELDELTISDLQDGMKSGKYTARANIEKYLERIAEMDKQGPSLHALIEVNPDALSIAEELDKERQQNQLRGPMHGIPVIIKDNIDTADKMTTTAGSFALEGSIPTQDSFVAHKLREAGADRKSVV